MNLTRDAERSVLGGILCDCDTIQPSLGTLRPGDFAEPKHAAIFAAMLALHERSSPIDVMTVRSEMAPEGEAKLDVATYLDGLADEIFTSANVGHHARIVRQEARRRDMLRACAAVAEKAKHEGCDADELLQHMVLRLGQLAEGRELVKPVTMAELVKDEFKAIQRRHAEGVVVGTQTGITPIDNVLGGLQVGGLVVIGGRPGTGKTALATNMVENMTLRDGKTALVFSLEMTREEQVQRSIASEGRVDLHKIRTGRGLGDNDWPKIAAAMNRLATDRFLLVDKPALDVAEVRSVARQTHARRKLDVVVVDYLQLMSGDGQTREQEVSGISRGLKALAMELRIPVIALSQLNRASVRDGNRPQLSHLRESGSLEQDASQVLLLFRDEENTPTETEVSIAKNRNGPTGMIKLRWTGWCTRFDALGAA